MRSYTGLWVFQRARADSLKKPTAVLKLWYFFLFRDLNLYHGKEILVVDKDNLIMNLR